MAKLAKVAMEQNENENENVAIIEENESVGIFIPENAPSLNQLALALGIPAVRLQSAQVAYKPIEGQPYNKNQINWESVTAFIERRLDKTDFDSVEAVYAAALEIEYTPKRGFGRSAGEGSVYGKFVFGSTPLRKGKLAVGDTIVRKKDKSEHKVLFVNDTIVVYEPIHEENEQVVSAAIGNRMFNMNFSFPEAKQE